MKNCTNSFRKYKCANGDCVYSPSQCPSSHICPSISRRYFCPNSGWCESTDRQCPRPCGTRNKDFKYDIKCTGLSTEYCVSGSWYCPPHCSDSKPYKCLQKKTCAKGANWCKSCYGFRCRDSGYCLSSYKKCNGHSDCSDGSDESNCPAKNDDDDSINLATWQIGLIVGAVLVVMAICYCWCCRKTKSDEQTTDASSQQSQAQGRSGPQFAGVTSAATSSPVGARNNYTPYPSYTPLPPGHSEGGYLPMETVPINTSPGYPPAAASASPANGNHAAPPPSYFDVMENEDHYKAKDSMLPSYEEYACGSTGSKPTYL